MNMFPRNIMDFDQFKSKYQNKPVIHFPNPEIDPIPSPSVSVIIITFEHKDYIKDAIEGALMQKTNFTFEILIGDDGSKDGTKEVCQKYTENNKQKIKLFLNSRDNNIKILGKPCGIFLYTYISFQAKGKFIAVCSGDDHWTDPYKLQKQYDFLISNPEYSLVYHPWIVKSRNQFSEFLLSPPKKDFPKASTMMHTNISHSLPLEFTQVIQEDVFIWFILKTIGKSNCIEEIKPTICLELSGSVSNSLDYHSFNMHVLNVGKKIVEAYTNTVHEYDSKLHLLSLIKNILNLSYNRKHIDIIAVLKIIILALKYNLFRALLKKMFISIKK